MSSILKYAEDFIFTFISRRARVFFLYFLIEKTASPYRLAAFLISVLFSPSFSSFIDPLIYTGNFSTH